MDPDDRPASAPVRPVLPPEDQAPPARRAGIPRGMLWALALAVVVLTVASWVALGAEQKSSPSSGDDVLKLDQNQPAGGEELRNNLDLVGHPAPASEFEVLAGGRSSLAATKGTPTIVNFWSSTCPACVKEMPDLERVRQRYDDRVTLVGLAVNDDPAAARDRADQTGVHYTLGLDPGGVIAQAFGVVALPGTALIDRDGTVVWFTDRPKALTEDELVALIDERLRP